MTATSHPTAYPIYSLTFWKHYLIHMRPYLFFVSGAAGLAGMAIAREFMMWRPASVLAFIAFFLSYGFGQALTDCYQVDTDRISAPYRPLSRGILNIATVKWVSLAGLSGVTLVLIWLNPYNLLLCLLAVIGLWYYSTAKRKYWFAGPPVNAAVVFLVVVMGYLAISGESLFHISRIEVLAAGGLSFFSYINFVLIGYLKDTTADRKTDYRTFPVVFGWDRAVIVGDLNLLACIILYIFLEPVNTGAIAWGALAILIGISGQLNAHLAPQKDEAHSTYPILSTVRTFIMFHLGVVVSMQPGMLLFTVLFYLAFELVIYFRPMRSQI